jgi:hypothetical protein
MFNSTVAGVVGNTEEIAEDGETHFNGMEITFLGTSSGGGIVDNEHFTDLDSPPPPRVCASIHRSA